ncbi:polysaccharide deacetylase family protein [Thermosyntropha sp.]|uniref:polysaccharide deacetylase family protein n=1 Tax=Thermosyntropha sp. TaxID=2740820 RepID=UPI0025D72931|nr:polysaccharide deacetylase family protein [Thermosyntropha sp.]MBO8158285.1 polysaccharide deacetylase family protein [Thermosyntropha sp.]
MKKVPVIILVIALILIAGIAAERFYFRTGEITLDNGFNWYENRSQNEIAAANEFAKERLENRYYVFVNGIFMDIGYEWDGVIYVPIRNISESLGWVVNWLPEMQLIQLVKGDEEAFVEIVNLFGKAYVELNRLENLLRLAEVQVHGGNIEIFTTGHKVPSISFNKLKRLNFYINGMKMTDRAVEYQGTKYIPARIFALSLGNRFKYDAEKGAAYINDKKIECVFIDGQAYSDLKQLEKVVNTENIEFGFRDFAVSSGNMLPVIYKGSGKEKTVALTFDDYLGESVYKLLEILDRYNVKATFFIIGSSIYQNADLVKEITSRGHVAANHTWDHLNCHSLTDDEVRAQLISTQLAIERCGGKAAHYFRPPGGYYDNKIVKIAQDIGLQTVLWSVNSTDADIHNTAADISQVVNRWVSPGAIVVMHTNRENTIEALPGIIEALQSRGYRFVTIEEMITSEGGK